MDLLAVWCFLLFFLFRRICEGYQQKRSKSAIEKGVKKPLYIESFLFVCFYCFACCYIGIWEWNMNVQSQSDWWGYQPLWLSAKGFLGCSIFSAETEKVLGKPWCYAKVFRDRDILNCLSVNVLFLKGLLFSLFYLLIWEREKKRGRETGWFVVPPIYSCIG